MCNGKQYIRYINKSLLCWLCLPCFSWAIGFQSVVTIKKQGVQNLNLSLKRLSSLVCFCRWSEEAGTYWDGETSPGGEVNSMYSICFGILIQRQKSLQGLIWSTYWVIQIRLRVKNSLFILFIFLSVYNHFMVMIASFGFI